VNSSVGENHAISNILNNENVNIYVTWYWLYNFLLNLNYKKEWDVLLNNQIISGDYSKTPFLVWSSTLFTENMPLASTRHGLCISANRSINTDNAVRQVRRAKSSEGNSHNFFQIVNSNPNPEWVFFFKKKSYNLEVMFRCIWIFFSEFIYII